MRQPANVELTFLRAMTFTVSAASLVLANAENSAWPAGLTPFVAVITYVLVDRRKLIRLPVYGANILGVIAFSVMMFEFWGGTLLTKLLSGAHLLVYMTWVVLLLQKGIRQFWWLAALSVLKVSIASVLTNNPQFGAALVGMLLAMIWMLSVFTLYRTQLRLVRSDEHVEDSLNVVEAATAGGVIVRNGLQIDTDERWIGWRFRSIVGFAFAASLFVGVIAFAVFPRVWVRGSALASVTPMRQALMHQTGFTDTVELGEIGEIMQSDRRVLQFEIFRMKDRSPVTTETFATETNMDEILFRGNVLGQYEDGKWTGGADRGSAWGDTNMRRHFNPRAGDADFRIRITQDAPIGSFAFAPVPVINAFNRETTGVIEQRRFTYSLTHQLRESRSRAEPLSYEVWCEAAAEPGRNHQPKPLRLQPPPSVIEGSYSSFSRAMRRLLHYGQEEQQFARHWFVTRDLQNRLPKLTETARKLCSDEGYLLAPKDCWQRIMHYLTTSGEFTYSLKAEINDPSLDPVEDFLVNRKAGHCEYFASACALMLQAVDVPARVVNGYKGSEVNTVSGRAEVKQKHAHTWVEVFVDGRWETLDPTPAAARDRIVSQTGRLDWWQDVRLTLSDGWYRLVQKMSLQRQEAMVRPWIEDAKKTLETIRQQGIWASLKMFYREVILKPEKWISVQGWFVTFFILLALGLAVRSRPGHWLRTQFRKIPAWFRTHDRQRSSVVKSYDSFRLLCSRHGLTLRDSDTARENAELAQHHFADVLQNSADRRLPERIAWAFNRVRFGDGELSAEAVESLRNDVSRFGLLISGRSRSESAGQSEPASENSPSANK